MKLVVFIPAYNCQEFIFSALKDLQENFLHQNDVCFLVVDNKSSDGTDNEIRKAVSELKLDIEVLFNDTNLGLGGSFKLAWLKCLEKKATHMAVFHGDHQASALDLAKMWMSIGSEESRDAVLGSRFENGSSLKNYSQIRHFVNLCFNLIVSVLYFRLVSDIGSGCNIYKLKSVDVDFVKKLPNHIAFDLELLIYFLKQKSKIIFFPIIWKQEGQKTTVNDFSLGFLLLKIIFYNRFK